MSLTREFTASVASGQTAIAIRTDEQPDAIATIAKVCARLKWPLRIWDRTKGLTDGKSPLRTAAGGGLDTPLATKSLMDFLTEEKTAAEKNIPTVMVVRNFNLCAHFENAPALISVVQHLAEEGKQALKFMVALITPNDKLPDVLAPLFYTIPHELPDEKELESVLKSIVGSDKKLVPEIIRSAGKAALGLNRLQAEGAFAMSMQKYQEIRPEVIWRYKVNILNEEGLVQLHEGTERFEQVGGLDGAKDFLKRVLDYDEYDMDDPEVRARGVALLGAPGVGKSLIAKCLGNETGRPVVHVNIGTLMGGLVGDTEAKTRRLFQILRRLAPVIAIIDEFGKQMPSTTSKKSDGGVSARLAGEFLKNMQDTKEDVFWVLTENNIAHMDRGFTRAERVDAIFYVKKPDSVQRAAIWRLYFQKYMPAQIRDKAYPGYAELDIDKLLAQFRESKKEIKHWAEKMTPALICLAGKERKRALAKIEEVSADLHTAVKVELFNDAQWTPAEIAACVRLMRRLKMSLMETQKRIGHVVVGDARRIAATERWASKNGALDAETGELFSLTVAKPAESVQIPTKRATRKAVKTEAYEDEEE